MADGAADFFSETQLAGAAVIKARKLIERRQFVDFICESFDTRERFELIGDLIPHANDRGLLIDEINTEEQHDTHERSHRLVQIKGIESILLVQERGKCKRS